MARQSNAAYWAQRLKNMEEALLDQSYSYVENLEAQFSRARAEIEKQIAAWYQRFASNNEISLAEAKRLLNSDELAEFHWTVGEYIAYGKQNAIDGMWMKQLENASARVHISRLDALKLQIQQQAEALYANQLDSVDAAARQIYEGSYYHTAFEVQKGLGVGWTTHAINEETIKKVLSRPWTADNQTFRDRCWTNKQNLVNSVNTQLTQMIIRGEAPDRAIAAISKQFDVSKSKAGRLVMTESAYFASAAQKDCYKELDVEQYQIVAALDHHTCDICGSLDGKVFKMSEYQEGLTAPPFHPWCRCCTAPYFDDMEGLGERFARDGETGERYKVPRDMTYEQWKKSFVAPTDAHIIDITAGGKFETLPYDMQHVEDYKKHIRSEYNAQRMTHADNEILWADDGGYIQNTDGYSDINEYMRGLKPALNNPKCETTLEVLERRTAGPALKHDYVGHRKVDVEYLQNVLGLDITGLIKPMRCKTNLGKRVKLNVPTGKDAAQALADSINGLTGTDKGRITDKAFTSISLCENINYFTHRPVKFEIQMPAGTRGLITNNYAESEFIAQPNTTLEIIGAEAYNDGEKDCVRIFARLLQE